MSPKSSEQFAQMRSDSRQKILESALEIFALKGYHSSSMAAVARNAGISKGLIYNYFQSKEELLFAIFDYLLQIFDSFAPEHLGNDPLTQLRVMTELSFDMIRRGDKHYRFVTGIITQPALQDLVRNYAGKVMHGKLRQFFSLFEQLGFPDPEQAAYSYAAIMDGIGLGYIAMGEEYPIEGMKAFVIETFCKKQAS